LHLVGYTLRIHTRYWRGNGNARMYAGGPGVDVNVTLKWFMSSSSVTKLLSCFVCKDKNCSMLARTSFSLNCANSFDVRLLDIPSKRPCHPVLRSLLCYCIRVSYCHFRSVVVVGTVRRSVTLSKRIHAVSIFLFFL